MVRPPTKSQLRAALWAFRARLIADRELRRANADELTLPGAPALGLAATRGVNAVLKLTRATCLERSMVLQRWYGAQGVARDVVIGVTSPRSGFRAHAWLEEPGQLTQAEFTEITRIRPTVDRTPAEGLTR